MDDEVETNQHRCTPADEAVPASFDGENDPPQPLALLSGGGNGPPVPGPIQQQDQLALGAEEEVEVHESALSICEEDSDRAPIPIQQQEKQLDDAKRKAKAEISTAIGARGRDERDSTTGLIVAEGREEDLRPSARSRVGALLGEVEEEAPSMSTSRQRSRPPSLCLADCDDNDPPVPIQQQEQLLSLDGQAVKNKKKQGSKAEEQQSVIGFVDEVGSDRAPIPFQQQMQEFDDAKEKTMSELSTVINGASGIDDRDSTTELTAEEMEEKGNFNLGPAAPKVGASWGELEEARVEISSMPTPRNNAADARLAPDEEIPIYDGIVVPTEVIEGTRLQTWVGNFQDNYKSILGLTILVIASAITVGIVLERRSNKLLGYQSKGVGEITYIPVSNEPTGQATLVPATPPAESTPLPSPRPQSDTPTDVLTPTHEQRPKWFQILHPDFQEMSLFYDENGVTTSQLAEAAMFCYRQGMFMCTYDVICPNGKGNPPFKGGPPNATNTDSLNETQWVPYYWSNLHPNPQKEKDEAGKIIQLDQKEGKQWAQIGKIPDGKGGSDENSYGLCWDYDEWSNYDGVDIEDIWAEETRVWLLCCSDPADENGNNVVVSGFKPTLRPTNNPTNDPTASKILTKNPTVPPTENPTLQPTNYLSSSVYPSNNPTASNVPTKYPTPTNYPTTSTYRAKLLAPDRAAHDEFGYSTAIYRDTIVVGAEGNDDNDDGFDSGSAHVFVRSGEEWTHQAKLLAPDGAASDRFGYTVAIYGDTIVVGAHWDDDKGSNSGSAHVFLRSGEEWTHQAKLLAPDGAGRDNFGLSVAIYGDTIVVGARYDDDNGLDSGSAHVFVRSGEEWTHQAKLLAPDGSSFDRFGGNVAIYEDSIVVGAQPSSWHQKERKMICLDTALQSSGMPLLLALLWAMTTDPAADRHTYFFEVERCGLIRPSSWRQTERMVITLEGVQLSTRIPSLLALGMMMTMAPTVDQRTSLLCDKKPWLKK